MLRKSRIGMESLLLCGGFCSFKMDLVENEDLEKIMSIK
jgi:hypothetical protein